MTLTRHENGAGATPTCGRSGGGGAAAAAHSSSTITRRLSGYKISLT